MSCFYYQYKGCYNIMKFLDLIKIKSIFTYIVHNIFKIYTVNRFCQFKSDRQGMVYSGLETVGISPPSLKISIGFSSMKIKLS